MICFRITGELKGFDLPGNFLLIASKKMAEKRIGRRRMRVLALACLIELRKKKVGRSISIIYFRVRDNVIFLKNYFYFS